MWFGYCWWHQYSSQWLLEYWEEKCLSPINSNFIIVRTNEHGNYRHSCYYQKKKVSSPYVPMRAWAISERKNVVLWVHHIHIFRVSNDAEIMKCQFNYSRRYGDDTLSMPFNSFAYHGVSFCFFVLASSPPCLCFKHTTIDCHQQRILHDAKYRKRSGEKAFGLGHTSSKQCPNRLRKMFHMLVIYTPCLKSYHESN